MKFTIISYQTIRVEASDQTNNRNETSEVSNTGCRISLGCYTKRCQENSHLRLLASLSKCASVTGRYVSQSHPGLNSIKESTETYGSGGSYMISVRCSFDSYHLLSGHWNKLSWGGLPQVGCSILKGLFKEMFTQKMKIQSLFPHLHADGNSPSSVTYLFFTYANMWQWVISFTCHSVFAHAPYSLCMPLPCFSASRWGLMCCDLIVPQSLKTLRKKWQFSLPGHLKCVYILFLLHISLSVSHWGGWGGTGKQITHYAVPETGCGKNNGGKPRIQGESCITVLPWNSLMFRGPWNLTQVSISMWMKKIWLNFNCWVNCSFKCLLNWSLIINRSWSFSLAAVNTQTLTLSINIFFC